MPFLSVVTRCYQRPRMLLRNITSLARQTTLDYEQIFLVDEEGRGVAWANANLQTAADRIRGQYVLILDDDNHMACDDAISQLSIAVLGRLPDIVMFKSEHGHHGILPDAHVWEGEPKKGHVDTCNAIVRADWWKEHIHAFAMPTCGDYHFLAELWEHDPDVIWYDRVLAGVQRISRGKPEHV